MNGEKLFAFVLDAKQLQWLNDALTAHAANSGQVSEVNKFFEETRTDERYDKWLESHYGTTQKPGGDALETGSVDASTNLNV